MTTLTDDPLDAVWDSGAYRMPGFPLAVARRFPFGLAQVGPVRVWWLVPGLTAAINRATDRLMATAASTRARADYYGARPPPWP
jgi:hypothetical protein